MKVIIGRTARIKTNFIPVAYMPSLESSILQSVQVAIPQQSFVAIKQIRSRDLAGIYRFNERPAQISFNWTISIEEAEAKFLNYMNYFKSRTNGIATDPAIGVNTFSYVSNVGYRQQGLNPPTFEVELFFLNCPDIYAEEFDPIEFFIDKDSESEAAIKIVEDLSSNDLVTERSFSISMRGDFDYALGGYRSFKLGEAIMSESVTSVDRDYLPVWKYDEHVHVETSTESHNRNLGTQGPRTYVTSRQAYLKSDGTPHEVQLGWL